eukprot:403356052
MEIDKNGPSSIGYSSKILFQQKQGALRNNARNLYVWGLQIFMTCELDLEQGLNIDNRNPAIIKLNDKDEIHPDDGFIIKGFSSQEDYVIAQSDSSLVSGGPFYHYLILEDANQQNPSNMIACYFKFNATIRNYTCLYINEGFSFQSGLRGHKPQISQASFIAQRDQITYLVLINFGDKEMVKKQLQVYNDKSLKMVSAFDRDQTKTLFFGVGFLTKEFSFQGSTTSPYSTYTSGFILEHQSSTCYLNSLKSLNYKITTTPLQIFSTLTIVDPADSTYANKFTKFALTSCIKPGSIFFPTTQYYDYYISQTSLNTSAPYNITTENIFFDGTQCPNDSFTFHEVLIQPLKSAVFYTTTPTKFIYEVQLYDSDINKTFNVTQTYTVQTSSGSKNVIYKYALNIHKKISICNDDFKRLSQEWLDWANFAMKQYVQKDYRINPQEKLTINLADEFKLDLLEKICTFKIIFIVDPMYNDYFTFSEYSLVFSTDNLDLINETIVFNLELVGVNSVSTQDQMIALPEMKQSIPTQQKVENQNHLLIYQIMSNLQQRQPKLMTLKILEFICFKQFVKINWTWDTITATFNKEENAYSESIFRLNVKYPEEINYKRFGINITELLNQTKPQQVQIKPLKKSKNYYEVTLKIVQIKVTGEMRLGYNRNIQKLNEYLAYFQQSRNYIYANNGISLSLSIDIFIFSNLLLNLFLSTSLQYLWGMINQIQIITHLPLNNINIPANAKYFFTIFIGICNFDILPSDYLLSLLIDISEESDGFNSNFIDMDIFKNIKTKQTQEFNSIKL